MVKARIEITGMKEISDKLHTLESATEKRVLRSALDAAISVLGNAIRERTPVKSGLTEASVGIDTHIDPSGERGASVVGFGRRGYIANFVEFGHRIVGHKPGKKDTGRRVPAHPFVRPAFDDKAKKSVEVFEEKIRAALDRALGKIGRA